MSLKNKKVTKKLFSQIMEEGVVFSGSIFLFRFIRNPNKPQYAFVAPKSTNKKAVDRNKMRRRGYAALRGFSVKNSQGIFFYKKSIIKKIPFIEIKKDIGFLLKKANII